MDPAFAAHTKILARRKKPKKAKPEKAIPTAGRDLNERALSKAAAAAREPGALEPDEEEGDWYTTAVAIEASAQSGSSLEGAGCMQCMHNGIRQGRQELHGGQRRLRESRRQHA